MTGKRRYPGPTPADHAAADDYRDRVARAEWECVHGVTCGSLIRPWSRTPACPLCRKSGYMHWRRLDTVDTIPAAYR